MMANAWRGLHGVLMRNKALAALYQSVQDRVALSEGEFAGAFSDWEVYPLKREGRVVGAFVSREGEVHVGFADKPKASILPQIRAHFLPLLERHGALTTRVLDSNKRGLLFCERIGFQEISRMNGLVFMRCERCNYE